MSWPLRPPVPLRSPPGSFPPVHTWPGWLCSDPQLPGSLNLLGRVACHLSCWRRGGGFRTRWGGTPGREEARAGRQGEGARGQQQVLGITRPSTPAGRAGLKGSLAVCPGEPLASSLSLWGTTSLFLLGGDSGWLGQWASWRSSGTANAPGWGWLPGGPLLSACPPPPHSRRTPRPAPSELLPRRASLCREAVAVPPYLCPRSGRLLVPRPQSPFDPLLGSEPCDPVGGPRAQAAGAARLSCWVSPRSLCSLQPRSARRGLSGGLAAGQPPSPAPQG